jgi:predicted metal-dependent hydrolase
MDFDYTIVRSPRRRKLTITVERDRSVVVHAPESTPVEKIHQVIEAKRQWIYEKIRHPQKYRNLPHPPGKELVNGESAFYLGRHYRIELAKSGLSEIRFNQRFYIPAAGAGKRQEVLREWYMQRAEDKIIPRVKYHARRLGVTYSKAKIVETDRSGYLFAPSGYQPA